MIKNLNILIFVLHEFNCGIFLIKRKNINWYKFDYTFFNHIVLIDNSPHEIAQYKHYLSDDIYCRYTKTRYYCNICLRSNLKEKYGFYIKNSCNYLNRCSLFTTQLKNSIRSFYRSKRRIMYNYHNKNSTYEIDFGDINQKMKITTILHYQTPENLYISISKELNKIYIPIIPLSETHQYSYYIVFKFDGVLINDLNITKDKDCLIKYSEGISSIDCSLKLDYKCFITKSGEYFKIYEESSYRYLDYNKCIKVVKVEELTDSHALSTGCLNKTNNISATEMASKNNDVKAPLIKITKKDFLNFDQFYKKFIQK